jgi:hypothetical protein
MINDDFKTSTRMRKIIILSILVSGIHIPVRSLAQSQEAAQLILNYEKLLQLEEILDNMYKGYKILSDGYNAIKNIAEGNFNLHQAFLNGLYAVNPAVKNYARIAQIIKDQQRLVSEYKNAFKKFKADDNLTAGEIIYIEKVYSDLAQQSLRNLDELIMVITASKLRMSDEERLESIDRIYDDMENKLAFLKLFNSGTQILAMQRAKAKQDVNSMRQLYKVTP